MSKHKRQNFEVPEEQQHDPITMPEPMEAIAVTPDPKSSEVLERTLSVAAGDIPRVPTELKTMIEQRPAKAVDFEQRVYRCVYDDAATARKVTIGDRDPDVFCQVCGNRMVRER